MYRINTILITLLFVLSACTKHPSVPTTFAESNAFPQITPDYTDVVMPCNIAAPTFMVEDADVVVAEIAYHGGKTTYGDGNKVLIDADEWKEICRTSAGENIAVTLYAKQGKTWTKYKTFDITIAEEEIDPYVTYRLIEPSYVAYDLIELCQRSLTDYDERPFADNRDSRRQGQAQCLNCHSFQNYQTDNMLYHVRGKNGGTMLRHKGEMRLMTQLRQDSMISNPVYPSWHPTLPLIAFSANKTGQLFHTQDVQKVEVQDTESHLVLYDVENDKMHQIASDITDLETFPTWTPDGTRIYYTSAKVEENTDAWMTDHYKDIHYNIYYRDFDAATLSCGERQLVCDMDSANESATLPRVSPDGRYLLYAAASFGCFHIWHTDADIRIIDLETGESRALDAMNSERAESYPSWSSNGRWIMTASRRDDGNYSRIYISYFDKDGNAHKAFALPQADPEHGKMLMRSFNRPEFVRNTINY